MQQDQIGPLTKRQIVSIFLIVCGSALVIIGRFFSLEPDWFWHMWQKNIIFYINGNGLNAYVLMLYIFGLIITASGFIVSAKSLFGHIKQHLLFYGIVTEIAGLSLLAVLIANAAYPFTFANDVQKYFNLPWLIRALFIEFLATSIVFAATGIALLSAFGLKKGHSQTSMKNVKKDIQEYIAIIKGPIQSHKKTVIGLILTLSGFTYLLIGAWPDPPILPDFPEGPYFWPWQKELAKLGSTTLWILYMFSFAVTAVGILILCYPKIMNKRK